MGFGGGTGPSNCITTVLVIGIFINSSNWSVAVLYHGVDYFAFCNWLIGKSVSLLKRVEWSGSNVCRHLFTSCSWNCRSVQTVSWSLVRLTHSTLAAIPTLDVSELNFF